VGDLARFTGLVDYPGDRYELYWESIGPGNLIASGTTVTSAVSAEFTVPEAPRGAHTVVLKDLDDSSIASATMTVLPSIDRIDPVSGAAGTRITVFGKGFGASEANIRITFNQTEMPVMAQADAKGSWTAVFDCPPVDKGKHSINARGSLTMSNELIPLTFTVGTRLTVNPSSGPAGSPVTITGSGFVQYESGIKVTFDGTVVKDDVRADNKGYWVYSYVVPAGSRKGVHTFGAYGPSTPGSEVGTASYSTGADLQITPTIGLVGSSFSVIGSGFAPNEREIQVTFDGSLLKDEISADGSGGWTASVQVPQRSKGRHSVRAGGPSTSFSDAPTQTFSINPSVSASPAHGPLGTEITIKGAGFDPNRVISVLYDTKPIAGEVATTRDGTFQAKFKVIEGKSGTHPLAISDESGSSFQLSFVIESDPPPAPKLNGPETDIRLTFFGGATVSFEWSPVQDPSGLSYVFELSRTADFAKPMISKTGMNETSHALGPKETLDFGDFYWRVRAIDNAGNAGNWSETRHIQVGVMQVWIFVLIVVAAVILFGGVLWFLWGKRGRYDF
jgi:hypothetical protein